MRSFLIVLLISLFASSGCGLLFSGAAVVAGNSGHLVHAARKVRSMPKSEMPGSKEETQLPAITQAWKASKDGSSQQLVAAIAVFDNQNKKCWVWRTVTYERASDNAPIKQVAVSSSDVDVGEVDCKDLGWPPPPLDPSHVKTI